MKITHRIPERQIRANYNDSSIVVYQAYNNKIAEKAVLYNTFVPPFTLQRMTWIKPSFFWMMYRSGWAVKYNQEHVLEIRISREGFERALNNACLSSYDVNFFKSKEEWVEIKDKSKVRIQWDPERDIFLNKLDYRSIQIGLSRYIVEEYLNDWIIEIKDITDLVHKTKKLIDFGKIDIAKNLIPLERIYIPAIKNKNWIGMY